VLLLAIFAAWLGAAPAHARSGFAAVGFPVYAGQAFAPCPWSPPVVYAPPLYYPPAFYLGSEYDPDYRDLRYNRYFQRYQPAPQIRGYTLPR
jgi:hypothetical protein